MLFFQIPRRVHLQFVRIDLIGRNVQAIGRSTRKRIRCGYGAYAVIIIQLLRFVLFIPRNRAVGVEKNRRYFSNFKIQRFAFQIENVAICLIMACQLQGKIGRIRRLRRIYLGIFVARRRKHIPCVLFVPCNVFFIGMIRYQGRAKFFRLHLPGAFCALFIVAVFQRFHRNGVRAYRRRERNEKFVRALHRGYDAVHADLISRRMFHRRPSNAQLCFVKLQNRRGKRLRYRKRFALFGAVDIIGFILFCPETAFGIIRNANVRSHRHRREIKQLTFGQRRIFGIVDAAQNVIARKRKNVIRLLTFGNLQHFYTERKFCRFAVGVSRSRGNNLQSVFPNFRRIRNLFLCRRNVLPRPAVQGNLVPARIFGARPINSPVLRRNFRRKQFRRHV